MTDDSLSCDSQEARKAQLENHEPEDEEEDMDMDKDMQDSGQFSFILCHCVSHHLIVTKLASCYTPVMSVCAN